MCVCVCVCVLFGFLVVFVLLLFCACVRACVRACVFCSLFVGGGGGKRCWWIYVVVFVFVVVVVDVVVWGVIKLLGAYALQERTLSCVCIPGATSYVCFLDTETASEKFDDKSEQAQGPNWESIRIPFS